MRVQVQARDERHRRLTGRGLRCDKLVCYNPVPMQVSCRIEGEPQRAMRHSGSPPVPWQSGSVVFDEADLEAGEART